MDGMDRRKSTADVKLWTFRAGQFELLDTLQPSASTLAVSGRLMRSRGVPDMALHQNITPKTGGLSSFRLFKWPFGGFTIFRHTHTISILHVTYLRLPMIIYRCLHICTVHVRFGICVPGSSSSVQNDQASSEIGLRIWAPKLQPPGAAAEMV